MERCKGAGGLQSKKDDGVEKDEVGQHRSREGRIVGRRAE